MDLITRYLGLELKHPVMASASPLTRAIWMFGCLQANG